MTKSKVRYITCEVVKKAKKENEKCIWGMEGKEGVITFKMMMTFEHLSKDSKGMREKAMWGKSSSGCKNSQCKSPEVRERSNKEDCVTLAE